MSLDRDQQRRMSVGGTQALPAAGKELGQIEWASEADELVKITDEKSSKHAIVWTVRLDDLKVIKKQLKTAVGKPDPEPAYDWIVGRASIAQALSEESNKITGVAFVSDGAPTLLQLEHGVSAEESVLIAASGAPIPDRETDAEFRAKCRHC